MTETIGAGNFDNVQNFESHKARIVVVGCGGGGSNTVTRLTEIGISGATTVAINTDAKHLSTTTKATKKILIGKTLTKGLGAGGFPEVGKQAAMESKNELKAILQDTDLVFITCGLGGGTGTGSAPVVAKLAKEAGAIAIAAVTLPFKLEGARIMKAEEGLGALRQSCDTVIAIENQKLLKLAGNMPLKQAFAMADDVIAMMIKGITETIAVPSLVNLDYADVKAVMRAGGVAAIGVGTSEADPEHRAEEAVYRALNHPLLEVDYSGAAGALIQVIGGNDMTLDEVSKVGEIVGTQLDPNAQTIWGARVLPEMDGKIQVISIVTGVKSPYILGAHQETAVAPVEAKSVQGRSSPSLRRPISNDLGIEVIG
ncbi:MAG: cell division protein FtsZ [Candidatus Aenigmarchaeota archaeon]|nr:cell division protein FtsZ [Candidatus Aenigmarchaeota archaeon]